MKTRFHYKKAVLSVIIAIAITFAPMTGAWALRPDTPSEWALDEVLKAREYGLIPADMFHSFVTDITRAEFCRLVMALYTKITGVAEKPYYTSVFTDTNNISILNAYGLGIVKGIGGGLFSPGTPITRQEIAVMLHNAIKAISAASEKNILRNTSVVVTFVDRDQTDEWAIEAIGSLRNNDIMLGDDRNRFNPLDNTTKEMAFILLNRIYLIYAGLDAKKAFPTAYTGEILMRIKGSFTGGSEYQIVGDVFEPYPDITTAGLNVYLDGEFFIDGDGASYRVNRSESLSESVSSGYAGGQYYPVYVFINDNKPLEKLFFISEGDFYRIYMDAGKKEPYFQKTFSDVLFAVPETTPILLDNASGAGAGAGTSAGMGTGTGTGATGTEEGSGSAGTGAGTGAVTGTGTGASGASSGDAGSGGAGDVSRSRSIQSDTPSVDPIEATESNASAGASAGGLDAAGNNAANTAGNGEAEERIADVQVPEASFGVTFLELNRDTPELLDLYMWRVQLSQGKVTRLAAMVFK